MDEKLLAQCQRLLDAKEAFAPFEAGIQAAVSPEAYAATLELVTAMSEVAATALARTTQAAAILNGEGS